MISVVVGSDDLLTSSVSLWRRQVASPRTKASTRMRQQATGHRDVLTSGFDRRGPKHSQEEGEAQERTCRLLGVSSQH